MKTQREFIPQIDVANDEVNRLDGEVATLRAQLKLPAAIIPPREGLMGDEPAGVGSVRERVLRESPTPGLTGLARAQAANARSKK